MKLNPDVDMLLRSLRRHRIGYKIDESLPPQVVLGNGAILYISPHNKKFATDTCNVKAKSKVAEDAYEKRVEKAFEVLKKLGYTEGELIPTTAYLVR